MPKLREVSEKELHMIVKSLIILEQNTNSMLIGLQDPGSIQHYKNDLDVLKGLNDDPYNKLVED